MDRYTMANHICPDGESINEKVLYEETAEDEARQGNELHWIRHPLMRTWCTRSKYTKPGATNRLRQDREGYYIIDALTEQHDPPREENRQEPARGSLSYNLEESVLPPRSDS